MTFVGRINLPDHNPPVRAYVHMAGLFECFKDPTNHDPLENAKHYFIEMLGEGSEELFSGFDFMLATIYGNPARKDRIINFFGRRGIIGKWPGNIDSHPFEVLEGVHSYELVMCGDTDIVLGKEEEYRRLTTSLEDYMKNPPRIGRFETQIPLEEL